MQSVTRCSFSAARAGAPARGRQRRPLRPRSLQRPPGQARGGPGAAAAEEPRCSRALRAARAERGHSGGLSHLLTGICGFSQTEVLCVQMDSAWIT